MEANFRCRVGISIIHQPTEERGKGEERGRKLDYSWVKKRDI